MLRNKVMSVSLSPAAAIIPASSTAGIQLRGLTKSFHSPQGVVHAVRGMGEVGKTQLAVEYAYAHAGDYDLVWWIAAEEPASIPDQRAA